MNEKTAEKTSLEIIRFINVPPARVYDAWTDPAQLREWFGPENVRTQKSHCGRAQSVANIGATLPARKGRK